MKQFGAKFANRYGFALWLSETTSLSQGVTLTNEVIIYRRIGSLYFYHNVTLDAVKLEKQNGRN